MMSVEGAGGLVTHLEPHLEQIFAPLIQATKARLMFEVTGNKFAEFGLRANENENNHVTLNHAVYVGAGFRLTSDDQAVFLFPEYFDDIGTVGHEFIMAYQQQGRTLEQAQELAFCDFVAANKRSALLTDTIDTLKSGLPAILKLIKENKGNGKIILPRFDSGDVPAQCIYWKKMTLDAGITETQMVVEDGYTPEKAKKTKQMYAAAGFNPEEIIVGAGGYFQENNLRDTASLVYKRSATEHDGRLEASLKFSDSPGKESIPGQIRIYEKGRNLVVAQEGEKIDGKMLSVQLVKNGRINYFENLAEQNARANTTWQNYDNIEYSPATQAIINERTKEKTEIMRRLR
jgi:nicotinic acid phosphoribosyltransferase